MKEKTVEERVKEMENFKANLWWRIPLGLLFLWIAIKLFLSGIGF